MGRFSGLFESTPSGVEFKSRSAQEAYFSVLYPIVKAKGGFGDVEMANLVGILMHTGLFADADLTDLTIKANYNIEKFGAKAMIESGLKTVNEKYRPRLFCYCAELILADGIVTKEEEQILEYLAQTAQLPVDLSENIIKVMMIRAGISTW